MQDAALSAFVKKEEEKIAKLRQKQLARQELKRYTKELMARFSAHMTDGAPPGVHDRDKKYLPDDQTELKQKSFYQIKLEELEASRESERVAKEVEEERQNEIIGQKEREVAELTAQIDEMRSTETTQAKRQQMTPPKLNC